jgi:probable phosphoglycerate mutase
LEKTTLYLIRHGEALGNINRRFQGSTDAPLTDRGKEQTKCLENRFLKIPVDVIYSSPLQRAYDTAMAVSRASGCSPVLVEPRLTEINGGDIEGMLWDEFPKQFPEEFDNWVNYPARFHAPHGETMAEVYKRVKEGLLYILEQNPGRRIVAATHGCAIRNALCFLLGYPIEEMNRVPLAENTAVSAFEINGEEFIPLFLNDKSHIPETLRMIRLWEEKKTL